MARRVGCRGERVVVVVAEDSGRVDSAGDLVFLEVPAAVAHLSDEQLLDRGRVAFDGQLVDGSAPKPREKLRVAMVGAWGIPCGIATYAEALWPEVGKLVGDWCVFAEKQDGVHDGPNVRAGLWQRGEPLGELAEALAAWKPDAVLIQHEYGLFPDARHWLSFIARIRPLRPIVTMHSIYHHKDKGICEAVVPEIVVHSDLAKAVLREKGIVSQAIHVIKHGCGPVQQQRLYNLYRSKNRFMQFGFGFRYKNWEAAIGAVALLKPEMPDIFYTGLFSEGLFSKQEHDRYYAELMALAERLGVVENIALIRGYQSEQSLDAFLGTNALACFPYTADPNHIVYGASGAARRAMQAGIPVIVSGVPHFADLDGVCPRADAPDTLAAEVRRLLVDEGARSAALAAQAGFMASNSWERQAAAYVGLLA